LPRIIVQQVELRDFRCFKERSISFDAPITILEGDNGSGKTTVLEALFYAANMYSFRTNKTNEIMRQETNCFFIRLGLVSHQNGEEQRNTLQIGCTDKKKLIKINNEHITFYNQIVEYYRVIHLVEDDMRIIQQGPIERRTFVDQSLLLLDPTVADLYKKFRVMLTQRNNALEKQMHTQIALYEMLTEQLYNVSCEIQIKRGIFLARLQNELDTLTSELQMPLSISCSYHDKYEITKYENATSFSKENSELFMKEIRFGRSMFGIHLDDIGFTFHEKSTRVFASRGQQKMLLLLLKVAVIRLLLAKEGSIPLVFMLDDFMTDFDRVRSAALLEIVYNLPVQLIFTAPSGGLSAMFGTNDMAKTISI
jgi:DNA replication and repair protein RecF